jgi:hypothetical protein
VVSNGLFGIIAMGLLGNLTLAGQSLINSLARSKRGLQKLQVLYKSKVKELTLSSISETRLCAKLVVNSIAHDI